MVRRALTRKTRWYQNRCSTFKNKDFIVEKPFWKNLEFWPLETSILTWAKKWPKWFRNDFSRAFERCLSFFATATRSRDHGGGRSNAPPPPAGGGKSRGPAGRGLREMCAQPCVAMATRSRNLTGFNRAVVECLYLLFFILTFLHDEWRRMTWYFVTTKQGENFSWFGLRLFSHKFCWKPCQLLPQSRCHCCVHQVAILSWSHFRYIPLFLIRLAPSFRMLPSASHCDH